MILFICWIVLGEKEYKGLFELYYVPLCYHARKYSLDQYESEEVVQQVFLKLWETRADLSIEKSARAYLYQSVKNQSINYLKQKSTSAKNKEGYLVSLDKAMAFSEITEEDGISALLARELEQQIIVAIEQLPDKCREIFLLSRKEYLPMKDIAEKLNISVNTVQKQISIAIYKIKDLLRCYMSPS